MSKDRKIPVFPNWFPFNDMVFDGHLKVGKIEIELEETAAATGQSVEQIIYDFWKFGPFVAPFRIGFFFQNLKRFEKPIPFNWPSGPIKPIFTDVNQNPALKKQIALADY